MPIKVQKDLPAKAILEKENIFIMAEDGMMEISGLHHRLLNSFSPGYGFTAVVVALLGNLNPLAVFVSGFFFAAMTVGANEMQRSAAIPTSLISVIQGLIVFFVLISEVKHFPIPRIFTSKRENREVTE